MKVSELQEMLKKYEPDTQLIVALWDKECFNSLDTEARLLTDKEWNTVAKEFVMQFHDQMLGADIRKALEKQQAVNDEWSEQLMNDILAEQRTNYEDSNLWDSPATKNIGVSNDN
jgi:Rod binding domain-containing protein